MRAEPNTASTSNTPAKAHRTAPIALAILALGAFVFASVSAQDASGQTTPPPANTAPPQPVDPETLPSNSKDDIYVPGVGPERPVLPPDGDPRGPQERRRDRLSWDKCVRRAVARESEIGQANPVAETPEEVCSRRLGMASRNAVPASRR